MHVILAEAISDITTVWMVPRVKCKYRTEWQKKQGEHEAVKILVSVPSSRSSGIISFTASKMPLCLASWPSSSLAQALQQPHAEQPDSPEPQPQMLVGGQMHKDKNQKWSFHGLKDLTLSQMSKFFLDLVSTYKHLTISTAETLCRISLRLPVCLSPYPPGTLSGRPLLTQLAP